ncbi:MAG: hypothetical protein R2695_21140, partial [Acidimicrobiales bacterium]
MAILAALALSFLSLEQASAAAGLSIEPITWNVIGLKSNDVTVGPNTFPVGAKVCNSGDAPATNVAADFAFTTSPSPVSISTAGPTHIAVGSLAPGECADVYFDVVVTRSTASFDAVRGYQITATGDGLTPVATPADRELYVERLVSQARNSIASITGPTAVTVGQTYQYTLTGSTAPGGYGQLEAFLGFPSSSFRVVSVATTYSVGGSTDRLYADACGWDNVPTSPTYLECAGTGKAGGSISTVYTVEILAPGVTTVSGVIYDFSGSSFHYNSDYGSVVLAITASNPVPTTTPTTTSTTTSTTTTSTTTTAPPTTPSTTTTTTAPPTTTST